MCVRNQALKSRGDESLPMMNVDVWGNRRRITFISSVSSFILGPRPTDGTKILQPSVVPGVYISLPFSLANGRGREMTPGLNIWLSEFIPKKDESTCHWSLLCLSSKFLNLKSFTTNHQRQRRKNKRFEGHKQISDGSFSPLSLVFVWYLPASC